MIDKRSYNAGDGIRQLHNSSYQGVKRLFLLAYNSTDGDDVNRSCWFFQKILPRVKIENYDTEIDGRNFYGQPINDTIKQYDEVWKVSTGQGDNYTTGC